MRDEQAAKARAKQYRKMIASQAERVTTDEGLAWWVRNCREWLTHLMAHLAREHEMTDKERRSMSDALARDFDEVYAAALARITATA